jgi:hypothetical protein
MTIAKNPSDALDSLLKTYWECAFKEGRDGRTTGTPDGLAQKTLASIKALLTTAALEPATTPDNNHRVAIRKKDLEMFSDLMTEASQVLQDPSKARVPLADELDGCAYMLIDALSSSKPVLSFEVSIDTMVERHRVTYLTTIVSSARPKDAKFYDSEGLVHTHQSEKLDHVREDAQSWADFLGAKPPSYTPLPGLAETLERLAKRNADLAAN